MKALASLMLFVSLFTVPPLYAQSVIPAETLLSQKQIADPHAVTAQLKNSTPAQRQEAALFFLAGSEAMSQARWSFASKAFGESSIRYPEPRYINAYAGARLRMLSEAHRQSSDMIGDAKSDLSHILSLYRAAIVANQAVNTLSHKESAVLRTNESCLTRWLESADEGRQCDPVKIWYQLSKG